MGGMNLVAATIADSKALRTISVSVERLSVTRLVEPGDEASSDDKTSRALERPSRRVGARLFVQSDREARFVVSIRFRKLKRWKRQ